MNTAVGGPVDGQQLTILGSLAKLNEHDEANRRNRFLGAKLKKQMTEFVALQAGQLEPVAYPVMIDFIWFISSKHDPDNISFAKKYVLDGLIQAGKLPNDNQNWIHGFSDSFRRVPAGEDQIIVLIRKSPLESLKTA